MPCPVGLNEDWIYGIIPSKITTSRENGKMTQKNASPLFLVILPGLYLALFLVLVSSRPAFADSRLSLSPANMPYQLECVRGTRLPADTDRILGMALCDLDGDGAQEFIECNTSKLLAYDQEDASGIKVRWEQHFPAGFQIDDQDVNFAVSFDSNGDNIEELYFAVISTNRTQWRFLGFDPATMEFSVNVELPSGEDRRPPATWDGSYVAEGVLADADGQGQPAILLVRRAGYDATLRGVCAVSPVDGHLIWEYVGGAQVAQNGIVLDDLDGDGLEEICLATSAPRNLGGRLINGTSDDRAYLIVLDQQGRTVWQTEFGGGFASGDLQTHDLTGDGHPEILLSVRNNQPGANHQLSVWSFQERRLLATNRRAAEFQGLVVVPGPRQGTFWLIAGSGNGSVTRFLYEKETLLLDRQVLQDENNIEVLGSGDFPLDGHLDIYLTLGVRGDFLILGTDLKARALYSGEENSEKSGILFWQRQANQMALVTANSHGQWILEATRSPGRLWARTFPWLLGLVGLLLLVMVFELGRRRGKHQSPLHPLMGAARMAADRRAFIALLHDLDDVHHQVVGKTKGLSRLVWLLEAHASNIAPGEELIQRIDQVLGDYVESVEPLLAAILQQAEDARFELGTVRSTRAALDGINRRVGVLADGQLKSEIVAANQQALSKEWGQVRKGFLHLRTTINDYFSTDPVRMIQGMLLVRTEEFNRAGVAVSLSGADEGGIPLLARIDNGDLRFVLDNLLDGALRAMRDQDKGDLKVRVTHQGREIALYFTDNGEGIEEARQTEVFSSRSSGRPGGGHGLFRSREILARWGGEIILSDSQPGQGTTFVVKLLATAHQTPTRSLHAQA
jgi:signal transduction histidine kinase